MIFIRIAISSIVNCTYLLYLPYDATYLEADM